MAEHLTPRALIPLALEFVQLSQGTDGSGHDHWHSIRVGRLSRRIAEGEVVDPDLAELAGLLHDIEDEKFSKDPEAGPVAVAAFLSSHNAEPSAIDAVVRVIREISFKGTFVPDSESTELCRVVRDADRLEAIGAIGVARTFAYGGLVGRPLHDPEIPPLLAETKDEYRNHVGTTLNHFEEKLLLLKDRLSTDTARTLAEDRHTFMVEFRERFLREWEGL